MCGGRKVTFCTHRLGNSNEFFGKHGEGNNFHMDSKYALSDFIKNLRHERSQNYQRFSLTPFSSYMKWCPTQTFFQCYSRTFTFFFTGEISQVLDALVINRL